MNFGQSVYEQYRFSSAGHAECACVSLAPRSPRFQLVAGALRFPCTERPTQPDPEHSGKSRLEHYLNACSISRREYSTNELFIKFRFRLDAFEIHSEFCRKGCPRVARRLADLHY